MPNVYLVEITEQPIELYKLLKIADLVSGGGEAKVLISEGYVLLNNEVEFQKRKKVYDGDYIQFGDNIIEVQFVGELAPDVEQTTEVMRTETKNNAKPPSAKKNKSKQKPKKTKENNSGKRRAISF